MFFNHTLVAWFMRFLNSLDGFQVRIVGCIACALNCLGKILISLHDVVCWSYCRLGDIFVFEKHCVGDSFVPGCFDKNYVASVMFWRRSEIPTVT